MVPNTIILSKYKITTRDTKQIQVRHQTESSLLVNLVLGVTCQNISVWSHVQNH